MSKTSNFIRQNFLKVTIPVVIALIIFAIYNFDATQELLIKNSKHKSELISDEINFIFKYKELSLEDLESELETEMQRLSNRLINYYFNGVDSIELANLDSISGVLGVDTSLVDLYVINRSGVVVNTTMRSDLNLNLYSFGPEFTKFLDDRFENNGFYCSRFGEEIKTGKLKKYSYEKTQDGKYLIEIGSYSPRADQIIQKFNKRLDSISKNQPSILEVELYVDDHNPLTINKANELDKIHQTVLAQTFKDGLNHTLIEMEGSTKMYYEYIFNVDKEIENNFRSVIRIKTNKSIEEEILGVAFAKTLFIFGGIIMILILLMLMNARSVYKPLKDLLKNVKRISEGEYRERTNISGQGEIAILSTLIDDMIDKLEIYEKQIKKQTGQIAAQKNQIKDKSDGVSDSIRYAKKIQNALFSSSNHVNQIFESNLLFYKPKSVVSGDFYWMEEYNGFKYFAIVDCTGHGVTGAFISLVGLNALNRTVKEYNLTDPSQILKKLNELLEETLQQKDAEIKDGMDIALCAYSKKDSKLYYSGANSPIYLVRNTRNGNVIMDHTWSEPGEESTDELNFYEIKGNRRPIGKFDNRDEEYTTIEIEVKRGDRLYLITDGIADQFGGKDGKKFRAKNVRKMIMDLQSHDLKEQHEPLLKIINDWILPGKYEQTDDMCVMAVEFTE